MWLIYIPGARRIKMFSNLPPSVTSTATNCASEGCLCERGAGQTGKETGGGSEKKKEIADKRKIVTVFLPPAGNELVKEKSE